MEQNTTIHVLLKRERTSDEGTEGTIYLPCGTTFFTLECPWRNNTPQISCVPEGEYTCVIRKSPKFGFTYHVQNVPNRSYILIHSGNFGGDTTKGYRSNILGCILLGKKRGVLQGQRAVLASKPAVWEFMSILEEKDFTLTITTN